MSEDPKLFDAGDYNLFRYCHNDPIDFTDPMGLEVSFGESLIPVWGSGHMAYDTFNEGHYAMAAFHTAMAITDVSGVKALGTIAAKAALKGVAKAAAERAATKLVQKTAAEKEGGLVIGKLKDVGKADGWRTGDHTANLPDRGSTKANWRQNSSELRAAERNGKPIRDVSSNANGNLRDNSGFLKAERNLLENRGRIYDSKRTPGSSPNRLNLSTFLPSSRTRNEIHQIIRGRATTDVYFESRFRDCGPASLRFSAVGVRLRLPQILSDGSSVCLS